MAGSLSVSLAFSVLVALVLSSSVSAASGIVRCDGGDLQGGADSCQASDPATSTLALASCPPSINIDTSGNPYYMFVGNTAGKKTGDKLDKGEFMDPPPAGETYYYERQHNNNANDVQFHFTSGCEGLKVDVYVGCYAPNCEATSPNNAFNYYEEFIGVALKSSGTLPISFDDSTGAGKPCEAQSGSVLHILITNARGSCVATPTPTPTPTLTPTRTPTPTGSSSSSGVEDPHIESWDGVHSTVFHEGDFVLAESPSTGLAIQGRFCRADRGPWASWICGLAVRCHTSAPVVEILANEFVTVRSSEHVQVLGRNVKALDCSSLGLKMLLTRHTHRRMPYINYALRIPNMGAASDIRGLAGSPNGDRSDDLSFRSGRLVEVSSAEHFIGHSSVEIDDAHLSWSVRANENMFRAPFVKSSRSVPTNLRPNVLGLPAGQLESAERHCRGSGLTQAVDLAVCVHDLTGLHHVEGGDNLAMFRKAVGRFMGN
mmetsp:Transcript_23092/g.39676  ORF Transcript_23092/g.39676 Transcript_23092/m.39676 type:complete len:487 (+) Transcript_23092:265-1725(+)|eukprot:CAMPEP_0196660454 /NCGR_PEP_ID=MMETSP1086-20130531/39868_1 /TAXON_ID=77921 /ORGANISM="Cyanoptyche  gloeocystis , Strain SAG4.97" /LENGTH=486 /DNA_ID=CAMNT_0041994881 /DNA_START=173 /DNA_END=1633 /DNA_ORIENTATION=+